MGNLTRLLKYTRFVFCLGCVCNTLFSFSTLRNCIQVGKWEEREYRLDELMKHRRVALTRTLPSLENPRLRGIVQKAVVTRLCFCKRTETCNLALLVKSGRIILTRTALADAPECLPFP